MHGRNLGPKLAAVALFLLAAWLCGCGRPPENVRLRLYAGAGLQEAIEALAAVFKDETGIAVEADYAGSGVLISRAKGDPQADLFMPGDVWYVDRLEEVTNNVAERVQIAYFVPTIIVAKGNPKNVSSLKDFARTDLKVALGNPQACQIGRLCVEIFANAGLDSAKLNAKESFTVNELGLWVQMKDVDAAIVWDAVAAGIRQSVDIVEIPAAVNEISTVVCARLKSAPHPREAQQFLQFLVSPTAQRLLRENGYRTERPYPMSERRVEEQLHPVGRRINGLSLLSGGMLVLCLLVVVGLVTADLLYLASKDLPLADIWKLFTAKSVVRALRLSLLTSLGTLVLVIVTATPAGYALSRFRFPGRAFVNALVDVPIFLPPVVIGVSLLAFFGFGLGGNIKQALSGMGISLVSWIGIVLCQYVMTMSYGIRSIKAAFDAAPRDLEHVAYTLGCSPWQAFWRVSLPLARPGVLAGCILVWARGIGVFGPLMVFVGTGPRVQVMPTMMWLELSVGNIEVSLAIALIMLVMAGAGLTVVHFLLRDRSHP